MDHFSAHESAAKKRTEPDFEIGQKVRKKHIGNGYIHGTVVDAQQHPDFDSVVYTVSWENGPVERSNELPRHLMKDEEFAFDPELFKRTANIPPVPHYDHRDRGKYKVGDVIQTAINVARVINTAHTPLGEMYRVKDVQSGNVFDIFIGDIKGKVDPKHLPYRQATIDTNPSFEENMARLASHAIRQTLNSIDAQHWIQRNHSNRESLRSVLSKIPHIAYPLIPWFVRQANEGHVRITGRHANHAVDAMHAISNFIFAQPGCFPKGLDLEKTTFAQLEMMAVQYRQS